MSIRLRNRAFSPTDVTVIEQAEAGDMPDDDTTLDRRSQRLLHALGRLRRLEGLKRAQTRSSPPFHALAEEVTEEAREVWQLAATQELAGEEDSPLPEERADESPGDWTRNTPKRQDVTADAGTVDSHR
jgi:hypothetical protein